MQFVAIVLSLCFLVKCILINWYFIRGFHMLRFCLNDFPEKNAFGVVGSSLVLEECIVDFLYAQNTDDYSDQWL